jgi:hypothetical protein
MKNWYGNRFYLLDITYFKTPQDKVDLFFERSQATACLCKYFFVALMPTIKYDLTKVWIEGWDIYRVVAGRKDEVVLKAGRTEVMDWTRWACLLISSRFLRYLIR